MPFMIKNTSPVLCTLDLNDGTEPTRIMPGKVAGPFKDEDITDGVRVAASRHGLAIFPVVEEAVANGSESAEPVELEQPEEEPPPIAATATTRTERNEP